MAFIELNSDQRRETVNTRQRFQTWRNAIQRERGYRGSLVWETTKGREYLLKSSYDEHGKRRQKSLGRRSLETEAIKDAFESQRADAIESRKTIDAALDRQAAVNRALALGRVPLIAARIIRLLDRRGLLGKGIRVVGTNALYAYEAAAGAFIHSDITATEDIDLLFDSRMRLNLIGDEELADDSLIQLLRLADRSFRRTTESFRAENDEGYLVDLIKPVPKPPLRADKASNGKADDIEAAEVEGLIWLQNAPSFEQVAIDDRGYPVRIEAVEPRVFAVHKLWVSSQANGDPVKKMRDRRQAFVTADLIQRYLVQFPLEASALRNMPKGVVEYGLKAFAERAANAPLKNPS